MGSVFGYDDFNGDGKMDIAAGVGLHDAAGNSDVGAVFLFMSLFDWDKPETKSPLAAKIV